MTAVKKFIFPEKIPYRPETADEFLAGYKHFDQANTGLSGGLSDLRGHAAIRLAEEGIPNPRLERWKYTDLAKAVKGLGGTLQSAKLEVREASAFVEKLEGKLANAPEWLQEMLTAEPVQEVRYADWALWHLANAYLEQGLVIDVPAGKVVDNPVEITAKGLETGFSSPRLIIRLGQGAELTVIERHNGGDRSWNNALTQVIVGDGAHLRHYRVQDYSDKVVSTQNTHVQIGRDATYEAFTLTTGSSLSRNQIHAELLGQNGTCNLYGLNLLQDKQLGDTTITIEHKAPNCNSNQFYRSVLDGLAHGVFQGKVHVYQEAQKTDGYQLSNTLLLSGGAEMDTKPELEIYADDVKCSHGATTGQLNEDALFYLRSRGIPENEARSLLIEAFAAEIMEKLVDRSLNSEIEQKVKAWLRTQG